MCAASPGARHDLMTAAAAAVVVEGCGCHLSEAFERNCIQNFHYFQQHDGYCLHQAEAVGVRGPSGLVPDHSSALAAAGTAREEDSAHARSSIGPTGCCCASA